jgi:DNA-binding NtrC family response regulator
MKAKILYLENHPHFSKMVIKEFLSEYSVILTANVSEAKEFVRGQIFDLALVDYDLDDGKGTEFIKYVKGMDIKLPMVACSSHEKGNCALLASGTIAVCSKLEFKKITSLIEGVINSLDRENF